MTTTPGRKDLEEADQRIPESVGLLVFWDIVVKKLFVLLDKNEDAALTIVHAYDILIMIEGNSKFVIVIRANRIMGVLTRWCDQVKLNMYSDVTVKLNVSAEKTSCALMKGNLKREPISKVELSLGKEQSDTLG